MHKTTYLFFSSSGPAFHFMPPRMERELCQPATTGLHHSHHAWAHLHTLPQQPQPHHGPPPPPWGPHAFSAHPTVVPAVWSSGHSRPRGPPPGFPWRLPPRPPAHLWLIPPGRHCAPSGGGHQPPAAPLPYLASTEPIQTSFPPALLHRLAGLRQFPPQPHQTKPVPLHVSVALVPFIPPAG